MFRLTKLIFFLFCNPSFLAEETQQRIFVPGDIVIGGLFPLHSNKTTCDELDIQNLLDSEVMVYAIEQINNSTLLSNVKLGYDIYDTCSCVSTALNATLKLARKELIEECVSSNHSYFNSAAKAVVGELDSEVSVAVARLLALPQMTQISYASTSELLSVRTKFPSFFRTVPSDKHQTEAIAQLVHKLNFVPVGIIGSEDEYGKYGADSLSVYLKQYNMCEEFKEILPADFSQSQSKIAEFQNKLRSWQSEAIVLFTSASNAKVILEEAIKIGSKRTWIAGDAWSTSKEILQLVNLSSSGWILGVTCKRNKVAGFKEYTDYLITQTMTGTSFLQRLLTQTPLCAPESQNIDCSSFAANPVNKTGNCIDKKCLVDFIAQMETYEPYSVYMAVYIIAYALKDLLQIHNDTHFQASMLTENVRKVNFSVDNTSFIFLNENGELNIGYDILQWKTESPLNIYAIGTFVQNLTLVEDVILEKYTMNVTQFGCSKSCSKGYILVSVNNSCCKQCLQCDFGLFSNGGTASQCTPCKPSDDPQCQIETFVIWQNGFSITLAVFSSIGIIITLFVSGLFVAHARTPIVRAAGGYLCFPTLISLLGCFCSVFLFLGKPTNITCLTGLPLFGLAFTVCVSCILANLLQIFVGFKFKMKFGDWLKCLNKPFIVVLACVSVQVVICACWLILIPPSVELDDKKKFKEMLIICSEGSTGYYVSMLVYIALLCLVCFIFAYKGKRLPDLYKNASFISISMLIYMVIWLIFIPVYISESGMYERTIQASAILVSSYAILGCHFAPKCYIIIWKKELNDENAIVDYIRNHYEKKGIRVVT